MRRAKSIVQDLYFHDGGINCIYYDLNQNELVMEISLPEEIKQLDYNYDKSLQGVLTFTNVQDESFEANMDFNQINHPFYSVEILAIKYFPEGSNENFDLIMIDLYISRSMDDYAYLGLKFLASNYQWLPYENKTHT